MKLLKLGLLSLLIAAESVSQEPVQPGPERWETAIAAFEAADREETPARGGILFVGSSTIRFWDLERSFPELHALNRGFGGSTVRDVLHYFDRLITPYAPKVIVFYSGDNDTARGETPQAVIEAYQEFFRRVHKALPETSILVLGIKPSVARIALWPKMQQVNQALEKLAGEDNRLTFIDTSLSLLDADGMPKRELLMDDGLHLNEAGYAAWNPLVEAALKTATGKTEAGER